MADLLLEIGVEELPAAYVPSALEQLGDKARALLEQARITHGAVHVSATPRRLVLSVEELAEVQPSVREEVAGPPASVAFRDGEPTRAAIGFARKLGLEPDALEVRETPRGPYVFAVRTVAGKPAREVLPELLRELVLELRFPKSMRWPQAPGEQTFARPVRRLLALFGGEVVAFRVFGLPSGRTTEGHALLAGRRPIALERADYQGYRSLLRQHVVIVERSERRERIAEALRERLAAHGGAEIDEALLEEVTDLVEWPAVCEGRFDPSYLELPDAVLEAAMTDHQRYFPVRDAKGALRPLFLFVANQPEPAPVVIEGNERVLRARLEDARFYMREDLKRLLSEREDELAGIVFHERLGTMQDKAERLQRLTAYLGEALGLEEEERRAAREAARLAKLDLTTELVAEFPQLQGQIGGEYLSRQGAPQAVCDAVAEHYRPRFAGDRLPERLAGVCVALADKLDNLASFFAAGLEPTGGADPYALRRQAHGVVRMLCERGLRLDLEEAIERALEALFAQGAPKPAKRRRRKGKEQEPEAVDGAEVAARVHRFLHERIAAYWRERGLRYDLVDAVLASLGRGGAVDFADLEGRLEALGRLADGAHFGDLVEVVDRCWRIVRGKMPAEEVAIDPERFEHPEERALFEALQALRPEFERLVRAGAYVDAAARYREALAAPVHAFFERVFVNAEDPAIRHNRLALLDAVRRLFVERFADLSKVVEGKK